jgi:hypothetical protein
MRKGIILLMAGKLQANLALARFTYPKTPAAPALDGLKLP